MRFIEILGRIITKGHVKKLKQELSYADIKEEPFRFIGINFLICLFLALISAFYLIIFYDLFYALAGSMFLVVMYDIFLSSFISLLAGQRAKYAESVLPDALLLMASNLRSGVPPEEALVLSARPEFGFLSERIKDAGKKLATGATIQEALLFLPQNINSSLLRRTIELIVEGINSGGEISTLLESTAYDIRDTESIRKEVRSMIFVYALFIFIAACLIAPVLYAVSIQLAGVLSKLSQAISVQFLVEKSPTVKLVPTGISQEFVTNFAYANLIITTSFGALIVALINRGDEKYGIRYIPFFLGLALLLFFIARLALNAFFGGIRVV